MPYPETATFFDYLLLYDDEEDDDDDEDAMIVFLAASFGKFSRAPFYVRDRLEWEIHIDELMQEGPHAFYQLYHMNHNSFAKLCSLIDPFVKVDPVMSKVRTGKGPITTEIALHCLLRWLGGGSYLDIRLCAGISITGFHNCVHKCMEAILCCDQLAYSFPKSEEDIEQAANNFKSLSTEGVISGCVACLDGFLLRIQTPASKETGNVKAYFSGHYQAYGINVQAACDSQCRFVFAALAGPGGANDIAAYRKTELPGLVENLPLGQYVIGDNAYVCSEHLLTPFAGTQKKEHMNDIYNFHLSQLRIRIEMAFGHLVNKWGILKRPLQVQLKNTGKVFMCLTRLHNFCINETAGKELTFTGQGADNTPFIPSDIRTASVQGVSIMRDILVEDISSLSLARPARNLHRSNI